MKKRYFLASLLALSIGVSGCSLANNDPYATDDHYDYFKDYDLTMFVQDTPKPINGNGVYFLATSKYRHLRLFFFYRYNSIFKC